MKKSYFKNPEENYNNLTDWIGKVEKNSGHVYDKVKIDTSLGKTQIYGFNIHDKSLQCLVILPGFRTSTLIWDLDGGLEKLAKKYRVIMIETNGQPNFSDGNSPLIKSNDYGNWCNEVFLALDISKAFVIGASFGGLVAMKFAITNPEKIKSIFLLNPGCLQPFSMTFTNLYYNLLPVIFPSKKNIDKFLGKIIFCTDNEIISNQARKLLTEYLLLALTSYKDNTQKPYDMKNELKNVNVDVYLIEGSLDLLFPYKKSIENAQELLPQLKNVKVFENIGHGIELYPKAIDYVLNTIKSIS